MPRTLKFHGGVWAAAAVDVGWVCPLKRKIKMERREPTSPPG